MKKKEIDDIAADVESRLEFLGGGVGYDEAAQYLAGYLAGRGLRWRGSAEPFTGEGLRRLLASWGWLQWDILPRPYSRDKGYMMALCSREWKNGTLTQRDTPLITPAGVAYIAQRLAAGCAGVNGKEAI